MTDQRRKELPDIAITGGCGLIGTRAVRALLSEYNVHVLDTDDWPDGDPPEGTTLLKVDLTDDRGVSEAIQELSRRTGGRLASFIHLAAYYDFSGASSPLYEELTVQGTRRLLRNLRDLNVGQFVFSSTLLVMEPAEPDDRLDESSPTEAEWPYPESKLAAEEVIRKERGSIPTVILRLAGAYDEDGHSPRLAYHIKRIYEKRLESYLFPGDKEHGQPYVHLDDVAECLRQVVNKRETLDDYEVLLIAEPDVMSHAELQEQLGYLIHRKKWPTIRIPKVMAKAGAWLKQNVLREEMFIKPWMVDLADDNYPVAIDKARRELGWTPEHRLRDVLPKMVGEMRSDPEEWFERNGLVEKQAEHRAS